MRIVAAALVAAALATPLDLVIEAVARQAFAVPPEFEPFQGTVAPYTIGGIALAAAAFAVVRQFARDISATYLRISIVALVLSWIPDVGLLVIHDPGATVPAVAALMVMHATTAIITVAALLRIARSG